MVQSGAVGEKVVEPVQRPVAGLAVGIGQLWGTPLGVGQLPLQRFKHVPHLAQGERVLGAVLATFDDAQADLERPGQVPGQHLVDVDQRQCLLLFRRDDHRGEEHREWDLPRPAPHATWTHDLLGVVRRPAVLHVGQDTGELAPADHGATAAGTGAVADAAA